jgi:hypothetical protein
LDHSKDRNFTVVTTVLIIVHCLELKDQQRFAAKRAFTARGKGKRGEPHLTGLLEKVSAYSLNSAFTICLKFWAYTIDTSKFSVTTMTMYFRQNP